MGKMVKACRKCHSQDLRKSYNPFSNALVCTGCGAKNTLKNVSYLDVGVTEPPAAPEECHLPKGEYISEDGVTWEPATPSEYMIAVQREGIRTQLKNMGMDDTFLHGPAGQQGPPGPTVPNYNRTFRGAAMLRGAGYTAAVLAQQNAMYAMRASGDMSGLDAMQYANMMEVQARAEAEEKRAQELSYEDKLSALGL